MKNKAKLLTLVASGLFLFMAFILSSPQITNSKSSTNNSRCSNSCSFSTKKDGVTYSVVTTADYYCRLGWPSWGCDLLQSEAIALLNPNTLSGSWAEGCGNVHSFNATIIAVDPPPANPTNGCTGSQCGGGGGCPSGQYYCDVSHSCIPNNTSCNNANPAFVSEERNPNIAAQVGPVHLLNLKLNPPVGNVGYQCRIVWGDSFASYDNATRCTFTGPNVSLSFNPASSTAPLFYESGGLQRDTAFKMSCREGDSGPVQSSEAVCRLNWNYVEVN